MPAADQQPNNSVADDNQAMREELLYRALFEQTNDAVFILDLEGNYLTVNTRAADLFGYTREDFQNLTFNDVVAAEQRQNAGAVLAQLSAGAVVPVYERVFVRQDGSHFTGEVNAQLVYDDDGSPVHIQSVIRDISERKHIEDDLHYHASLLENVSDAIISTSMEGDILSWNQAAETIYGWEADEVIGKRLDDVLKTSLKGGREQDIKNQYIIRGYWSSEVTQFRRDGTPIDIRSSVSLLRDSRGRPIGTVAVNHDITRSKEIESELNNRVNHMAALGQVDAEISSTLKLDQVLLFSLNAAISLSGAESGFIVLLHADRVQRVHTYGRYAYLEEKDTELKLYGITRRVVESLQPQFIYNVDDDPNYVPDLPDTHSLMSFPLISRDRVVGAVTLETQEENHFSSDIFDFVKLLTSRLAAAIDNARLYQLSQNQLDELQHLYFQVSKLEQLKTDMIRIASHDLRNPVGLINGYIELLRLDTFERLSEAEIDYVESISRAVTRMQGIIDDILSLERIQQVAQEEIADHIDLPALVRKVINSQSHDAAERAHLIDIEIPEPGLTVVGDQAQIYEALANLVSNAIKYTPQEGKIRVMVYRRENETVCVRIEDSGYGIPEEQQNRLFEPFFRAKTSETETISGVGLGLHLVKNIIERHNGKLIFSSVYGKGSTFGFELPLAYVAGNDDDDSDSTQLDFGG